VQRVIDALAALGHAEPPVMLDAAARTAQQAADALGVQLGQIAKSIVFRHVDSSRAVLVVCAGDRRVDEHAVAAQVGQLARADADFVRATTGFAIGGVSPVGHTQPPIALLDDSLWRFDRICAAAGHPHAVFALQPDDLMRWLAVQPSALSAPLAAR
jgi:prolyl-tRNA editing enzyme YbaK/EbsC (Cys-tRNA(Pro) deacylase)